MSVLKYYSSGMPGAPQIDTSANGSMIPLFDAVFQFNNLEYRYDEYYVKIDNKYFIYGIKIDHSIELGSININVDTSCLESSKFKVRCIKHETGDVIGEYPLENDQCIIHNLIKHDFYDIILIDENDTFEYQTMSKRIAR